ncbi:hypothetical protein [Methylocystis parvus]|uniref:hypothetical protein n=1 Tax=Methylocystis parvus TaxID=134 RepID=UPI003C73DA9A
MSELPAEGTILVVALSGQQILTPWSARGVTETLTPIEQNIPPRRNVNGALRDISFAAFQKYRIELTCKDVNAPALDGVWRGQSLLISCVHELSFRTAGGSPARPVVSGSTRVEGDFTYYRPQILAKVMDFSLGKDEWPADVSWRMILDEV